MSDPRDIEKWAWAAPVGGNQKLVLLCLAKHADWDTLECYPSQERIARQCGISVRTVRDTITALVEAGLVLRVEQGEPKNRRLREANVVALNAPELIASPAESSRDHRQFSPRSPAESAAQQSHRTSQGNNAREDDLFETPPGAPTSAPPDTYFADAWAIWPRIGRVRSSKATSARQWDKQAQAAGGGHALFQAVERYAASPDALKEGGQYVPAMERWLRDGRWEHWRSGPNPIKPVDMRVGDDDWQ